MKKMILSMYMLVGSVAAHEQAREFMYPVAQMSNSILVMYQRNLEDVELFAWDPVSKVVTPLLLPTAVPASVCVLPGDAGIGFVDRGRIMIKSLNKRTAKSILFTEPLSDTSVVQWNGKSCCFMTRRGERSVILHASDSGDVTTLISGDDFDALYPQRVGDTLFFVSRTKDRRYSLMRASYPDIVPCAHGLCANPEEVKKRSLDLIAQKGTELHPLVSQFDSLISFGNASVAFLHMESEQEGYYVEHPSIIHGSDPVIYFKYYRVFQTESGWGHELLFVFGIPVYLIQGTDCVYESMLPFLPKHQERIIYFVSCDGQPLYTNVFAYQLDTKTTIRVSELSHNVLLGPLPTGSVVYYGTDAPVTWYNEQGLLCVNLPDASGIE